MHNQDKAQFVEDKNKTKQKTCLVSNSLISHLKEVPKLRVATVLPDDSQKPMQRQTHETKQNFDYFIFQSKAKSELMP